MNPRKQRFYIAAAGVLAVIALLWSFIGSPVVLWHNHQLKTALTGLTDTSITLEQAVPFSWDEVYTFAPYTSVEEIQEVIGDTSFNLKEAESEGVLQLVFLDGGAVTAAVCAYPAALGYDVDMASAVDSTPCKLTYGENISFTVERDGGVVRLTAQAAQ